MGKRMGYLDDVIRWMSRVSVVAAGVFILGITFLIVAGVIYRFFGHVIQGSYEIISLAIVVTVAFALGYTALHKSHVVVEIVVSRFKPRAQAFIAIFISIIYLGILITLVWASIEVINTRWLAEMSEGLSIPYLPFRFTFVIGLIIWCLVVLAELFRALRQAANK